MPQTFLGQPPYDQAEAHDFVLGRVEAPAEQVSQVLDHRPNTRPCLALPLLNSCLKKSRLASRMSWIRTVTFCPNGSTAFQESASGTWRRSKSSGPRTSTCRASRTS